MPLRLAGATEAASEGASDPASAAPSDTPEPAGTLGSFSGGVNRASVQSRISGELEAEEFSLEESADGVQVSAVWQGTLLAGSCGKEIRGTWNSATNRTLYPFVMRKLPG